MSLLKQRVILFTYSMYELLMFIFYIFIILKKTIAGHTSCPTNPCLDQPHSDLNCHPPDLNSTGRSVLKAL